MLAGGSDGGCTEDRNRSSMLLSMQSGRGDCTVYSVQLLLSAVQAGITLVTELQRGGGVFQVLYLQHFWVRYHKCWPEVTKFSATTETSTVHCKKVIVFPVLSRDVTNQTLPDRELLNYPGQGEFGYRHPGRDGKIKSLFYSVINMLLISSFFMRYYTDH